MLSNKQACQRAASAPSSATQNSGSEGCTDTFADHKILANKIIATTDKLQNDLNKLLTSIAQNCPTRFTTTPQLLAAYINTPFSKTISKIKADLHTIDQKILVGIEPYLSFLITLASTDHVNQSALDIPSEELANIIETIKPLNLVKIRQDRNSAYTYKFNHKTFKLLLSAAHDLHTILHHPEQSKKLLNQRWNPAYFAKWSTAAALLFNNAIFSDQKAERFFAFFTHPSFDWSQQFKSLWYIFYALKIETGYTLPDPIREFISKFKIDTGYFKKTPNELFIFLPQIVIRKPTQITPSSSTTRNLLTTLKSKSLDNLKVYFSNAQRRRINNEGASLTNQFKTLYGHARTTLDLEKLERQEIQKLINNSSADVKQAYRIESSRYTADLLDIYYKILIHNSPTSDYTAAVTQYLFCLQGLNSIVIYNTSIQLVPLDLEALLPPVINKKDKSLFLNHISKSLLLAIRFNKPDILEGYLNHSTLHTQENHALLILCALYTQNNSFLSTFIKKSPIKHLNFFCDTWLDLLITTQSKNTKTLRQMQYCFDRVINNHYESKKLRYLNPFTLTPLISKVLSEYHPKNSKYTVQFLLTLLRICQNDFDLDHFINQLSEPENSSNTSLNSEHISLLANDLLLPFLIYKLQNNPTITKHSIDSQLSKEPSHPEWVRDCLINALWLKTPDLFLTDYLEIFCSLDFWKKQVSLSSYIQLEFNHTTGIYLLRQHLLAFKSIKINIALDFEIASTLKQLFETSNLAPLNNIDNYFPTDLTPQIYNPITLKAFFNSKSPGEAIEIKEVHIALFPYQSDFLPPSDEAKTDVIFGCYFSENGLLFQLAQIDIELTKENIDIYNDLFSNVLRELLSTTLLSNKIAILTTAFSYAIASKNTYFWSAWLSEKHKNSFYELLIEEQAYNFLWMLYRAQPEYCLRLISSLAQAVFKSESDILIGLNFPHYAALTEDLNLLSIIQQKGADLSQKTSLGTPIECALYGNERPKFKAVEALMRKTGNFQFRLSKIASPYFHGLKRKDLSQDNFPWLWQMQEIYTNVTATLTASGFNPPKEAIRIFEAYIHYVLSAYEFKSEGQFEHLKSAWRNWSKIFAASITPTNKAKPFSVDKLVDNINKYDIENYFSPLHESDRFLELREWFLGFEDTFCEVFLHIFSIYKCIEVTQANKADSESPPPEDNTIYARALKLFELSNTKISQLFEGINYFELYHLTREGIWFLLNNAILQSPRANINEIVPEPLYKVFIKNMKNPGSDEQTAIDMTFDILKFVLDKGEVLFKPYFQQQLRSYVQKISRRSNLHGTKVIEGYNILQTLFYEPMANTLDQNIKPIPSLSTLPKQHVDESFDKSFIEALPSKPLAPKQHTFVTQVVNTLYENHFFTTYFDTPTPPKITLKRLSSARSSAASIASSISAVSISTAQSDDSDASSNTDNATSQMHTAGVEILNILATVAGTSFQYYKNCQKAKKQNYLLDFLGSNAITAINHIHYIALYLSKLLHDVLTDKKVDAINCAILSRLVTDALVAYIKGGRAKRKALLINTRDKKKPASEVILKAIYKSKSPEKINFNLGHATSCQLELSGLIHSAHIIYKGKVYVLSSSNKAKTPKYAITLLKFHLPPSITPNNLNNNFSSHNYQTIGTYDESKLEETEQANNSFSHYFKHYALKRSTPPEQSWKNLLDMRMKISRKRSSHTIKNALQKSSAGAQASGPAPASGSASGQGFMALSRAHSLQFSPSPSTTQPTIPGSSLPLFSDTGITNKNSTSPR